MPHELDGLSKEILAHIDEHPGVSLPEVLDQFVGRLSESALRRRIRDLDLMLLIEIKPSCCWPKDEQRIKKILNATEPTSDEEADP